MSSNTDIFKEADSIIHGDRNDSYGSYERESERIAAGWSLLTGFEIMPEQVPMMMIWLKLSREAFKHKRDNLVDICGYAGLLDELMGSSGGSNLSRDLPEKPNSVSEEEWEELTGGIDTRCDSMYYAWGETNRCMKEAGHDLPHVADRPDVTYEIKWDDPIDAVRLNREMLKRAV